MNAMGNFNRGDRGGRPGGSARYASRSDAGGGRGFERRGFSDRGSRGPVEMHQAVCDSCRKNCEVPFRPTSGKPIFCSDCFQSNRGSDSRRSTNSDDRQMFEAVCDECGNSCRVPFQPSSGKPVYCSNCFGEKKGAGDRNKDQSQSQYTAQLAELNNKLDKILILLAPNAFAKQAPVITEEIVIDELSDQPIEDQVVEEKVKVAKKKSSKKK